MTQPLEPQRFDPEAATEREFAAINAYQNVLRAESWPEDGPRPVSYTVQSFRGLKLLKDMRIDTFFIWDGAQVCAEAEAEVPLRDDNRHLGFAGVSVHPDYRRRGLARRLLHNVAEVMQRETRRLIGFGTDDAVPAGAAFAEHLGAKPGMQTHTNQLELSALNPELLRSWQETAPKDSFELGFWDGPFPEADIAAISELIGVMNTAPRDALELEDFRLTPEQLRDYERYQAEVGTHRWVAYVRERATGNLAGYTELSWNPSNPRVLRQGDTGVEPAYRGHGLGKWLKAALLERVLAERPDATCVRTGNADSNVPMLKINHALGFKPRLAEVWWELPLDKLQAYLGRP